MDWSMKRDELKERILDLKWHALPYYERWAYPRKLCKEKNLHLKRQWRAQRWHAIHVKIMAVLLVMFAIGTFFYPDTGWQLSAFFFVSAVVLSLVEIVLQRRLRMLSKAAKLRKKLKKKKK